MTISRGSAGLSDFMVVSIYFSKRVHNKKSDRPTPAGLTCCRILVAKGFREKSQEA